MPNNNSEVWGPLIDEEFNNWDKHPIDTLHIEFRKSILKVQGPFFDRQNKIHPLKKSTKITKQNAMLFASEQKLYNCRLSKQINNRNLRTILTRDRLSEHSLAIEGAGTDRDAPGQTGQTGQTVLSASHCQQWAMETDLHFLTKCVQIYSDVQMSLHQRNDTSVSVCQWGGEAPISVGGEGWMPSLCCGICPVMNWGATPENSNNDIFKMLLMHIMYC